MNFADIDELTLLLHSTKIVATKTDLPEHNKLELCRSSKLSGCEYTEPVAMGIIYNYKLDEAVFVHLTKA